ncbi:unnamed protein product, partial [Scytosiphon promiscuus]
MRRTRVGGHVRFPSISDVEPSTERLHVDMLVELRPRREHHSHCDEDVFVGAAWSTLACFLRRPFLVPHGRKIDDDDDQGFFFPRSTATNRGRSLCLVRSQEGWRNVYRVPKAVQYFRDVVCLGVADNLFQTAPLSLNVQDALYFDRDRCSAERDKIGRRHESYRGWRSRGFRPPHSKTPPCARWRPYRFG